MIRHIFFNRIFNRNSAIATAQIVHIVDRNLFGNWS